MTLVREPGTNQIVIMSLEHDELGGSDRAGTSDDEQSDHR
jgi:hypothetical protein